MPLRGLSARFGVVGRRGDMRGYKRLGLPLFLMGSVLGTASIANAQGTPQSAAIQVPNLSGQDLGISYRDLLGVVRQQQTEIDALKKRLEALEKNKAYAADKSPGSGGPTAKVVQASVPGIALKSRGNGAAPAQPTAPTELRSGTGLQAVPASLPGAPFKRQASVNQAQVPAAPIELPNEETGPETPQGPQPTPPAAGGSQPQGAPSPGGPQPPQALPAEEERPKAEKPTEQLLVQQNAILLPAGTIQIEPGLDYQHYYNNSVNIAGFTIFNAIVIGTIDVDKVDRTIVTGSVTGRYGIFNRLQADVRVPYVYRTDSTIFGVGTSTVSDVSISGNGMGDTEVGLSYQPLIGSGAIPNVIVRARGVIPTGISPFDVGTQTINGRKILKTAPTGNGYYAAGLQATGVWRTDPLVLYAGAGFTYNFPFNPGAQFGEIKPGNTVNWVGGAVVALNDTVSLNLSLQASQSFASFQNGTKVLGSESSDARLLLGTSIGITRNMTLLITGTVGLTTDAPAYGVTVSLPFSF